ncbi:hypothetical protein KKF86_07320 [bacterium]|nr:hypothetical protein [bacterium]
MDTKNIATIFNQRLSGFGKLAQNGADVEEYHHHLYQLIIRTKNNRYPKAYDFDNVQLKNTELEEVMWMKIELTIWEGNMLPGAIESLKNYCALTK